MSERPRDSVTLLPTTAEALEALNVVGYVGRVNVDLQAMAWLVLVLKEVADHPRVFPHGKWATIQSIEAQLAEAAKRVAGQVTVPA